jgi:hypothetical protein
MRLALGSILRKPLAKARGKRLEQGGRRMTIFCSGVNVHRNLLRAG